MFYDDYYVTDNQKAIFKVIVELSQNHKYVTIQELDYLKFPRKEIEKTLAYFEKYGMFKEIQHLEKNHPVIFRV